jgi:RNA polymerase primary sigma factor
MIKNIRIRQNIINRTELVNSFFADINKHQPLTRDEEHRLFIEYAETKNEAIKQRIFNANVRFVVSVARKYENAENSLLDLIQLGCMGMWEKAIDRFDYKTGNKFISFAVWWINCYISNGIHKNTKVRIPDNGLNVMRKIEKFKEDFYMENKTHATIYDIETETEVSTTYINQIHNARTICSTDDYLDSEEEGLCIADTLKSDIETDQTGELDAKALIPIFLKHVSPKDAQMLKMMFGINCKQHTVREIAEKMNQTHQAINQSYHKCIRQLRAKYKAANLTPATLTV